MKNSAILFLIFLLFSCQSKQVEEKSEDTDKDSIEKSETGEENVEMEDTFGLAQFKKELREGFIDYEENGYIYFSELKHDYGLLITDHQYDQIEETDYALFYKNEKKIFRTSDFKKLEEKLAALPKGQILDWYDTCTFSQWMTFSDEKRKVLEDLCKSLGIILIPPSYEKSQNIICYCDKINNIGMDY